MAPSFPRNGTFFCPCASRRWTPAGAHRLLQLRIQVLNGDWRAALARWYPAIEAARERKAA
jgi:hypothetical protein